MKTVRLAAMLTLPLLTASCLYSPLSRTFTQWSADICGRKTFFERLCTGSVVLLMLPIQVGAVIADVPLSMLEFFFGFAPFKDPLVKTSSVDFHEHRFQGNKAGEEWIARRITDGTGQFHVRRLMDGELVDEYVMTPSEGGLIKVYAERNSTISRLVARDYQAAFLPAESEWAR